MSAADHEPPPRDAEIVDDDEQTTSDGPSRAITRPDDSLPRRVIALPLNQRPVFPTMVLPLVIPAGRLADSIRYAVENLGGFVAFFLTRATLDEGGDFQFADLHDLGCIARVMKTEAHEESGGLQILAQVLARFQATGLESERPYVLVHGHDIRTRFDPADRQIRAYAMAIVTALKDLSEHNPVFADEIQMVLSNFNNIDGPGRLADLAATLTTAKRDDLQRVLETIDIIPRMERVLGLLAQEKDLSQLKARISSQINERVSEHQRRFFLHEQLKAIKEELGLETDEKSLEIQRFNERFEACREAMSDDALSATEEELRKISLLDPSSSEYGVARNRLEWLLGMPWGTVTEDRLDIDALRAGLDADHHGLEEVKERIIEFVAIRRLQRDQGGGIVCLVGPPGTGKTSVGASIADQLGRRFFRFSVGGMRDEAEIKGHRRTYVGALPGKLVQALRRCGSMNPVVLLDEIDKLTASMQGDPAAALLEVLDPEQNKDFLDHYLDVRVDLSRVLFICTANDIGGIPEPLQDRMELIRLAGYIEEEKVAIAKRYLVPKQRQRAGLTTRDINIQVGALRTLVRGYAREAGVRRLEQLIAKICRKVAKAKATAASRDVTAAFDKRRVSAAALTDYLGKPHISDEELIGRPTAGVVTGLAWTSLGGATLEVEAIAIPAEQGGFTLSGQLGDVMKESAGLARSYLRAHAERFGIDADWFDRQQIHLHVPAGATPKDGPSAGITMATAMCSLALGRAVRRKFGMTGELTLTGRVYPIGGVREKIVAARRAGLKTIVFPQANERDVDELPEHLRRKIDIHFVSHLDEVLALAGLLD